MIDTGQLRQVLGLPANPTTGEVRIARRGFAKRAHPDLHGEGRGRVMADVNEACDRLIARIRRGERRGPTSPQPSPAAPAAPPVVRRSAGPAFRPVYALSTIAVTILAATATLLLGGVLDTTAVAVALLVGGLSGLAFLIALTRMLKQR